MIQSHYIGVFKSNLEFYEPGIEPRPFASTPQGFYLLDYLGSIDR